MARAQGARAQMALAFETVYGTPPAGGFTKMPFASTTLGAEQPLLNSELLGYGRDPLAPIKDAVTADGDVVVPLDAEAFGFWLKAAFGAPSTTGTGPWTHEFQSGAWTLPSLSIESGMPEVPRYAMYSGCVLDQITWQMQRSGLLTATARLVAQGETVGTTTSAGTPAALELKRFGHFNGSITRNGSALATALRDVIADQCGPRRYTAVDDLLSKAAPRLVTGTLQQVTDPVAGTIAAVAAMDGTVLPIQGPPGTGKTYVTARAILSLVRQGARVGVTSNSHEAIRNVLMGCLAALEDADLPITLDLVHKTSGDDDSYPDDCPVRRTTDNAEAAGGRQVVGATAWFFSRDENVQAFDWLFVDEAGQVGLANMVAMGRSARNIVLVGDPRQLPQVIQGAHPEPANLSCLDWMLGDHATVPRDRGIFLPVSRRMHPDVCRFISDQVYEGRLTSHPDTSRQAVAGTAFPSAGAFWVSVPHEGNAQIAPEEIEAIKAAARELLTAAWTEKDGTTRPMRQSDIIVVAPYNAQVNALRDALPDGIRVGTVDKFQGQEAPVCLVSMTASSAEETPRGMDFLFSLNRINVAVSRAKGLALVFGAPRLREAKCETVEQMRLVNTLCALNTPCSPPTVPSGAIPPALLATLKAQKA